MTSFGNKSESKLTKYYVLRASSALSGALPKTCKFSRRALYKFLDRYRKVIAKPASGSGGAGVILVTGLGGGRYRGQRGAKRKTKHGKKAAYKHLAAKSKRAISCSRAYRLLASTARCLTSESWCGEKADSLG
ncbi:hypothetical protein QNK09_19685 [Brevibacillus agri]|nr:YheC/YheD family protein [Brevibacillus agri]WHX29292.1 hypothetical protein QNK09_19685 [Brevibacillus agri]